MPYAEPFVQLRLNGSFGPTGGSPLEQWSVGIKLRNPGTAPSPANLAAFLAAAEGPIETYHAHSNSGVGSNCFLQTLTAAYIGTDGRYVGGGAQQTTERVTGPTPGVGSTPLPWTTAIVISLRTLLSRGPGSNGRLYYPCIGLGIAAADGRMLAGNAAGIATNAKAMLDGVNSAAETHLPGTGGVAVMSKVGTGIAATVTSIRVGRRLDRQERRENDLTEDYQTATLAALALAVRVDDRAPIGG